MNKILFLLIFFCSFGYGQKLIVTSDGLKNADEPERTFVVINVEGKNSKQLYENALRFVNKTYENPDKVIKAQMANEYLKISTHVTDFLIIKNSFAKVAISGDYTIELTFKDNKVKFDVVSINMYDRSRKYNLLFKGEGALSGYYIYNKKDELKKPEAKIDLENFFNTQISNLSEYLKKDISDDKW